jgi:hypothetical protein
MVIKLKFQGYLALTNLSLIQSTSLGQEYFELGFFISYSSTLPFSVQLRFRTRGIIHEFLSFGQLRGFRIMRFFLPEDKEDPLGR